MQKAIEQTIAAFDKIDVVVNNAGYALVGSFEKLTNQEIRQNFDVNLFGTLNVIRKVMPYLRKQELGHIFNIASIAAYIAMVGVLVVTMPQNYLWSVCLNLWQMT